MKARTRNTWRLARLNRRLTYWAAEGRWYKRQIRGNGNRAFPPIEDCTGKNHRQGPRITDDLKPAEGIVLAPPTEPKRNPPERPAALPSWFLMRGYVRKGAGYALPVRWGIQRP